MLMWFETVNLIKRDQKWVKISSLGAGSAVSLRAFSTLGTLVHKNLSGQTLNLQLFLRTFITHGLTVSVKPTKKIFQRFTGN